MKYWKYIPSGDYMAVMIIVIIWACLAYYFTGTYNALIIICLSAVAHIIALLFHFLTWFSNYWDQQKDKLK